MSPEILREKKANVRVRVVSILVIFFVIILIVKLFSVQVVNGDRFAERADRQYVSVNSDVFERGTIYFQDKDGKLVSAATTRRGYKMAIVPQEVEDADALYERLAGVVDLDRDDFIKRANKKNDPYEEVAYQLDEEQVKEIREMDLDPVRIYKQRWRFYPGESLASHVIGFMGFKGDEYQGQYGIERSYDDVLAWNQDDLYVNFFAETFANIGETITHNKQQQGHLVTTIEPSVQSFLEQKLSGLMEKWDSEASGGIVINPQDGSIYALASTPQFDLNNHSDTSLSAFNNPLVQNVYEMGSVVKPLIMSIGVDTGQVSASTPFNDTGSVKVGKHTIYNYDKKGRGNIRLRDVLAQSLNTGMVYISRQVSKPKIREYLLKYGLGEKTGIDLPGEGVGLVSNLESKRDIEFANVSFGQGIAITPIELVRALSTMANGGTLITPHIADRIQFNGTGLSKKFKFPTGDQVIKPETAEEVTRILTSVIDEQIHDGKSKFEHHTVAAKTGTAQIPDPTGGYYDDRNLHSFFGYFPAYDPQFLVFLYTVHPKNVKYSSQTLADPFLEMTDYLINYYEVPPDR